MQDGTYPCHHLNMHCLVLASGRQPMTSWRSRERRRSSAVQHLLGSQKVSSSLGGKRKYIAWRCHNVDQGILEARGGELDTGLLVSAVVVLFFGMSSCQMVPCSYGKETFLHLYPISHFKSLLLLPFWHSSFLSFFFAIGIQTIALLHLHSNNLGGKVSGKVYWNGLGGPKNTLGLQKGKNAIKMGHGCVGAIAQ